MTTELTSSAIALTPAEHLERLRDLPKDLDLVSILSYELAYYLRCAFDGATQHPDELVPEEWCAGAALSVKAKLVAMGILEEE